MNVAATKLGVRTILGKKYGNDIMGKQKYLKRTKKIEEILRKYWENRISMINCKFKNEKQNFNDK